MKNAKSLYTHIDNGGLWFHITEGEYGITKMVFNTQYFGYPSIEAKLEGHIPMQYLRDIAQAILTYTDCHDENNK